MVSLLESALKAKIAAGFKGKLLTGVLRREVNLGLDDNGDPEGLTATTYTFEGTRDTFSAFYKAQSGIPETDVAVLILQGSFKPATTITMADEGMKVKVNSPWNQWYQVRKVLSVDPAGASAQLQCYEIPDPTILTLGPEPLTLSNIPLVRLTYGGEALLYQGQDLTLGEITAPQPLTLGS